jgi:hypothetical protein
MKKNLKKFIDLVFLLFAFGVWAFSFYKIAVYLKLDQTFGIQACCECPDFNCPSCCPCPPFCWPTPTPTEIPIEPSPTPTLTEPTPTPTPQESEPSATPTLTPTPTSLPAVGGDGGGGDGGTAGPPHCGAEVPAAPRLVNLDRPKPAEVILVWTPVEPTTHYAIVYGLTSGNYLYGVDNTGKVTSFTVGGLNPNADYCFAVRAVNDCAPSPLSNELCTTKTLGAAAGQVLGVSTLGATGDSTEKLFLYSFIIGCVCFSCGLKILASRLPAGRQAKKLA